MDKYNTNQWKIDSKLKQLTSHPQIQEAAMWIKNNEVVAFPTETVYGLGANALADDAVEKIFTAKGRPNDNPLIVHIASQQQLSELVSEVTEVAQKLINHFWPGPLTIVVNSNGKASNKVTAGLSTVAVRMPAHPVALALIEASGLPLAAPSANRSGKPSPTIAAHVFADLDGKIAGIIDGGITGVGLESTVLDLTGEVPMILRPGGVTKTEIERVIGKVIVDPSLVEAKEVPKSPGMKYTHYAPDAPLFIVNGDKIKLQDFVNQAQKQGKKVGVLTTEEDQYFYEADVVLPCGSRQDLSSVARSLYHVLREFDLQDLDVIYSESFPKVDVGEAVMNRLLKAAGNRII
ncbi:L-threonylcarbamoyladenylate synthase [Bacillus solimangrovi]|uniref:Threonylcarbamoyl-AMP synthase n=1 Tax=Bacillus solimangrovi TaxID=1305675 RepID=A0A1E5LGT8_9BACI|nr:L-threonylcarbamoyladenylate synthase [Bacillus solimangrovi]OEH93301.1 threonylcarbamoyl-AMP synthase [Bacillus solimangrovi]